MKFIATASHTLQQSEDGRYQISRTPKSEGGRYTYRAWHRPSNEILAEITVCDESGERAAAVVECANACAEHREAGLDGPEPA